MEIKVKNIETKLATERETWSENKRKLRIIFDNKEKEISSSKQSLKVKESATTGVALVETVAVVGKRTGFDRGAAGEEGARAGKGARARRELGSGRERGARREL